MRLWLPFPPSLNSLYPGTVRRHKSKKYEAWIQEAKRSLSQQHFTCMDGPVSVTYRLARPDKRNRDLANSEKALSDLLVTCGALKDDSLIHRLVMEWASDIESGVDIIIEPL